VRLAVRDLVSGYGSGPIVDGVDLDVADGEVVAVIGRNGMGKSTFVRSLLALTPERAGSVQIDGVDVLHDEPHAIIRRGIAYGPQEAAIFPELSVRDNLYGGLRGRRVDPATESLLFETFPVVGRRLAQPAGTLSGGEQKQLVFTRCMLREPAALFVDEISAGLQPSMVDAVAHTLNATRAERPLTVLMVEQNVDLCLAVADRVVVMKRGSFAATVGRQAPDARDELLEHLAP
jgi:ABC-type branched-subunit amino acid transport system ATPase component